MADDLTLYGSAQQAERSLFLGASDADGCYRKAAYRYLLVPESNVRSTDAADLGTLLHLGWSAMIRSQYDPSERDVDVAIEVPGMPRPVEADDVDYRERVVTDVKTAKASVWESWGRNGVYDHFWTQTDLYALGLRVKHGGDWRLRIVAINRETGERREFWRDADPESAQATVDKVRTRHEALLGAVENGGSPDDFPREGKGPGRGFPCDWCSWLDACWPDAEGPFSPQAETIRDDAAEVEGWIEAYKEAAYAEGKAKSAKDDARAFLSGISGTFGKWRLSWNGGKERPPTVDCDAAAARLEELGEPVPMKSQTPTAVRINVTLAPDQD